MVNVKDRLAELDVLLDVLDLNDWLKIPENIILSIKHNKNYNYNWNYDFTIPFEEQKINNDTLMLFLLIVYKYIASEEEKKQIDKILENNTIEYNKKYNIENIFKKKDAQITNDNIKETETINDQQSLVKYKDNIFDKIKKYFSKFFKRNK